MKKRFSVFLLVLFLVELCVANDSTSTKPGSIDSNSQYFEGKVVYQHQIMNPNQALISDEEFYESMPNGGKSMVTMYIRGNKYRIDDDKTSQIYQPLANSVSIYKKNDSIYNAFAGTVEDPIEKAEKSEIKATVLGHACIAIDIQTKWESRIYLYSPSQLKTNPYYWKNHQKDYLNVTAGKTGNFPLLIRQKSSLGNFELKAVSIEKMKLTEDIFEHPIQK
jgi:hypothetical protein